MLDDVDALADRDLALFADQRPEAVLRERLAQAGYRSNGASAYPVGSA
jgi:hypothetical protein